MLRFPGAELGDVPTDVLIDGMNRSRVLSADESAEQDDAGQKRRKQNGVPVLPHEVNPQENVCGFIRNYVADQFRWSKYNKNLV